MDTKIIELLQYSEQIIQTILVIILIYLSYRVYRRKDNKLFKYFSYALAALFIQNLVVLFISFQSLCCNRQIFNEPWSIIIFVLNITPTYIILFALHESAKLEEIFSTGRFRLKKSYFRYFIVFSFLLLVLLMAVRLDIFKGKISQEDRTSFKYFLNTFLAFINALSLYSFNRYIKKEGVLPFGNWFHNGIKGFAIIQFLPLVYLILLYLKVEQDLLIMTELVSELLFISISVMIIGGLNKGLEDIHETETRNKDNIKIISILNNILGRTFHEIISPMHVIENKINLLDRNDPSTQNDLRISKDVQRQIDIMKEAYTRLATIISASIEMYETQSSDNYTDLFERGILMPIRMEIDDKSINQLIEIALMNFKNAYNKNKVRFIREYASGCIIKCNSVELVQIFLNLFKNSLEAKNVGCEIHVKTRIDNSEEEKRIRVEISDNGPGIPEVIQNRVFEQGFSTKAKEGQRRGFGLDIVKEFTVKNGGAIRIESPIVENGIGKVGTKFILIFKKSI